MTAAETAMVPAPEAAPAPAPQFARGFDGMAVEPFPEDTRRILAEPLNPHDVEIKPDGIVFLPGVAYRRILTRAFGAGGWAIAPRSPARYMKDNNIVVYHGALFCLGRFVAEAVGECFYRDNNPNMSYASCVEGAKTDALGRCCKDLGIGTEMWDANWREQWKTKYATSYEDKQSGRLKWKLRSRVSNPHDLMAGAGGVAPPAAAAPPAASTPPTDQMPSGSSAPADGPEPSPLGSASHKPPHGTASSGYSGAEAAEPPPPGGYADTGEAATTEQKEAIKAQFKRLQFKNGYIKLWAAQTFGLVVTDVRRVLEAFSQRQADAAFTLLLAHGTDNYRKIRQELAATGAVLADKDDVPW